MPDWDTLILGLGETGFAAAQFLFNQGERIAIADSRPDPPYLKQIQNDWPNISVHWGKLSTEQLKRASRIVISPGIDPKQTAIQTVQNQGIPVISEIDLFSHYATAPVVAITGSNGKSTVTALVHQMALQAGLRAYAGGNLSPPAISLLAHDTPDLYVLEISSYQLQTTSNLQSKTATVLNVTPDHLDRHESFHAYQQTKWGIYQNCARPVFNRDIQNPDFVKPNYSYTMNVPGSNDFGIRNQQGGLYFAHGTRSLFPTTICQLSGQHQWANVLAACALAHAVGIPYSAMEEAIYTFQGLPHRCQNVAEIDGVHWFNDSKATNLEATLAAIRGLGPSYPKRLILILGGQAKQEDFTPLLPALCDYAKACIVFGQDAPLILHTVEKEIPTFEVRHLKQAVEKAQNLASPKDAVLFSPACASFDMFENFAERGKMFIKLINAL